LRNEVKLELFSKDYLKHSPTENSFKNDKKFEIKEEREEVEIKPVLKKAEIYNDEPKLPEISKKPNLYKADPKNRSPEILKKTAKYS